jgi:hypothetical protein
VLCSSVPCITFVFCIGGSSFACGARMQLETAMALQALRGVAAEAMA